MDTTTLTSVHKYSAENEEAEDIIEKETNASPPGDNQISCWNGLYVFVIVLACTLLTFLQNLISRQKQIIYPRFWYESIIVAAMNMALHTAPILLWNVTLLRRSSLYFRLG